jgi:protein-S-isoprenylcysteine O-methyltransferase Ste14
MIDRLIRWTVASWFLLLALTIAFGIGTALSTDTAMTELDYARLASKVCLLSFLAMMGYLTLVRDTPVAQAAGWQPRVSALVGTNLVFIGLFFLSPRTDLGIFYHLLSAGLVLTGNLLAIYVLSHLGRSFSIMAEARKLVSDGPYGVIRHPLYLAEQIAVLGIFIQYASLATALLITVHFTFQIRRMLNEERILGATFPEYAAYMTRTARLVPAIW